MGEAERVNAGQGARAAHELANDAAFWRHQEHALAVYAAPISLVRTWLVARSDSERTRALVAALDQDYRAFLDRVRKESREQASLMAVEPVTLSEIQGLLPEGTTLLEYMVTDCDLVIWVVDRQRFTVVRVPGDRQSLLAQVRRFRAAITGVADLGDIQTQAEALYRRLLDPVRADIRGSRLLIVPHGVLHYLPFVARRSPDGHWVMEDFAVSPLPSASVLRYLADKGTGAPRK